jgi:thioredoxin reductase (NADPH)
MLQEGALPPPDICEPMTDTSAPDLPLGSTTPGVSDGHDDVIRDLVVIGAGPVGLACAIEAQRRGLTARVLDKGALVNSILGYPLNMEFFSTPDLIEIGGHPFPIRQYKPTREDALDKYRLVAARDALDVRVYDPVLDIRGSRGNFTIITEKTRHIGRYVVLATGFFDRPNMLNVPGEGLPKVTHYYREPYPYAGQKVVVVGAKNSAAKAALDCYRHGAQVTLIVRSATLSDSVKYWIRPDLENRIKEGSIRALFNTCLTEIRETSVIVQRDGAAEEIPNDWVLAMTGYHPDFSFLERAGITFMDNSTRAPIFDENTFETARPGVYVAGTVCGGYQTNRWFIENGRFHARQIVTHITGGHPVANVFKGVHWKTEE